VFRWDYAQVIGNREGVYRMKMLKSVVLVVLMAALVFVMVACGKDNPQSLAKESYEVAEQMKTALTNPAKLAELTKKSQEIAAKVEALSDADKEVYQQEIMKYMGDLLGDLEDLEADEPAEEAEKE